MERLCKHSSCRKAAQNTPDCARSVPNSRYASEIRSSIATFWKACRWRFLLGTGGIGETLRRHPPECVLGVFVRLSTVYILSVCVPAAAMTRRCFLKEAPPALRPLHHLLRSTSPITLPGSIRRHTFESAAYRRGENVDGLDAQVRGALTRAASSDSHSPRRRWIGSPFAVRRHRQ